MQIDIYCELYWAVKRPALTFALNGKVYSSDLEIIESLLNQERARYSFKTEDYVDHNKLEITLYDKSDEKVTAECDHWVSIKDIAIDSVRSDWLLFKHTVFRHSMPDNWVENMASQGYDIQSEYMPGSDMRLNGTCTFDFSLPFWEQRLLEHHQVGKKTHG